MNVINYVFVSHIVEFIIIEVSFLTYSFLQIITDIFLMEFGTHLKALVIDLTEWLMVLEIMS